MTEQTVLNQLIYMLFNLKIELLQLVPGKSSPVSHQALGTDPDCSCTACFPSIQVLIAVCTPQASYSCLYQIENTDACVQS